MDWGSIVYLARDRVTAADRLLPRPVGDRNRTRPFPFAVDPIRRHRRRVNPIREKAPPDPCGCRSSGVCHPAATATTIRCATISASGAVPRKCWRRQSLLIISGNPVEIKEKKKNKLKIGHKRETKKLSCALLCTTTNLISSETSLDRNQD